MYIFALSDKVSLSKVNHVSTFPTAKAIEEIVDKLLTQKIHIYYEGKLINDHDMFVMLELNYEKIKTFMEKLEDGHISQGLKVCFLETVKNLQNVNLLTNFSKQVAHHGAFVFMESIASHCFTNYVFVDTFKLKVE